MHSLQSPETGVDPIIPPSSDDISFAINVLKRLKPVDVESNEELGMVGTKLFGRAIRKKLFETDEGLYFLKKRGEFRSMLRKLEKIHNEVQYVHADFVQSSRGSGINVVRECRSSDVNSKGLVALTTSTALLNLMESAYLNQTNEFLLENGTPSAEFLISTCNTISAHENNNSGFLDGTNLEDIADFENLTLLDSQQQEKSKDFLETSKVTRVKLQSNNKSNRKSKAKKSSAQAHHHSEPEDFRMGGLGRSRGRKAPFRPDAVIGMYDDPEFELEEETSLARFTEADGVEDDDVLVDSEKLTTVRRKGTVFFQTREGTKAEVTN